MNIFKKIKKIICSALKKYYYNKMELVAKDQKAEDNIKKAYDVLIIMDFFNCDMPLLQEKIKKVLRLKLDLTSSFRQKP